MNPQPSRNKPCTLLLVLLSLLLLPFQAGAVGTVEGHARVQRSQGHPEKGFIELYEWDVWLTENGEAENRVRRTGAPPLEGVRHDGYYGFYPPAGVYSLFLHQPEWWVRPKVVPNILVKDGATLTVNAEPPTDMAVGFGHNMGPWQGAGEPWAWAEVWHQTFTARGSSVTKVQWKFAGREATRIRVSIHEVRGDNPENWPQVGPARILREAGIQNDNWIGWLSGEVPTEPGSVYAVRLADADGSKPMGPFVHRDALGMGYAHGTAYADGTEQSYDLYMTISSDSDGTLIAYGKRHPGKPAGRQDWAQSWGQTWKAKGKSLAALDLFAASGASDYSARTVAWVRVYEDGPGGAPVGPAKKVQMAWWGPGTGLFGVSYNPGEAPLEPGADYYVELTATQPASPGVEDPGFSPLSFVLEDDTYADGVAFQSGEPRLDVDLEMTIVEWDSSPPVPPARPTPTPPDPAGNLLRNGNMNRGETGLDTHPVPESWTKWNNGNTAYWFTEEHGRNDTPGSRVIGGSINQTEIQGGIVQKVGGLDPDQDYRLSGWSRTSRLTDKWYKTFIGFDLTGQTADPFAPTVQWKEMGRITYEWEQAVSGNIRPKADSISVWTRGENHSKLELFWSDFDDFVLAPVE